MERKLTLRRGDPWHQQDQMVDYLGTTLIYSLDMDKPPKGFKVLKKEKHTVQIGIRGPNATHEIRFGILGNEKVAWCKYTFSSGDLLGPPQLIRVRK